MKVMFSRPVDLNGNTEEEIINEVLAHYESAKMSVSEVMETNRKIIEAYDNEGSIHYDLDVVEPAQDVRVPIMSHYIDSMAEQIVSMFFDPNRNYLEFKDWRTKQRNFALEHDIFTILKQGNYHMALYKVAIHACMFSFGIIKLIPNYDIGIPVPEVVNNFNFFCDPYARTIDEAQFICHRTSKPREGIIEGMKRGYYDKKACNRLLEEVKLTDQKGKPSPQTRTDVRMDDDEYERKYDRYQIIEHWTRDYITTIAEKRYVIRRIKNEIGFPFYLFFTKMPVLDRMYVKSYGEQLLYLQNYINANASQYNDNVNQQTHAPRIYDESAFTRPDLLDCSGKNPIPVNGRPSDVVHFVQMPDLTGQLSNREAVLRGYADEICGLTNASMGLPVKKERMNVLETQNVYNTAMVRPRLIQQIFIHTGVIPLIRGIMRMTLAMGGTVSEFMLRHMAPATAEPISHPSQLVSIPPELFANNMEIVVNVDPEKEQRDRQNAGTLHSLLNGNPYVRQDVLTRFTTAHIYPSYPPELIKTEEEVKMEQMQQMQQVAMLGGNPQMPQPQQNTLTGGQSFQ